jgi:hypothetical protein
VDIDSEKMETDLDTAEWLGGSFISELDLMSEPAKSGFQLSQWKMLFLWMAS